MVHVNQAKILEFYKVPVGGAHPDVELRRYLGRTEMLSLREQEKDVVLALGEADLGAAAPRGKGGSRPREDQLDVSPRSGVGRYQEFPAAGTQVLAGG